MNKSIKPLGCVLVVSDLMLATYIVTIVIFFRKNAHVVGKIEINSVIISQTWKVWI